MNKQLSLFNFIDKTFYDKVQDVIDNIISSHDLPVNSIHQYSNISNKGANAGKETSRSICIFEPEYPKNPAVKEEPGRNFVILKMQIKKDSSVELFIRKEQANEIAIPDTATIKILKSDPNFQHVNFGENDDSIYDFIKKNILYCLANYEATSIDVFK